MLRNRKFFIIIVGCGRLGSYLANRFSSDGHSVVVIDINQSAFDSLTAEFSGFRIEGDATEIAVLKQAKAEKADLVIAATHADNVNLMVAQVLQKILHVPKVIARVLDAEREEIYHELGVETICPTSLIGSAFLDSLKELWNPGK